MPTIKKESFGKLSDGQEAILKAMSSRLPIMARVSFQCVSATKVLPIVSC